MRGHGQIIAMGLNIPHISLSTQEKVYDYAHLNGFGDYTLDTLKDMKPTDDLFMQEYKQRLNLMIDRLKEDEKYLLEWYNKRDEFVKQSRNGFFKMCNIIVDIIKGL